MPNILKELDVNLDGNQIFELLPKISKEINGETKEKKIIQNSPFIGQVKLFFPSVWGWGGMTLDIQLTENEQRNTVLSMKGYIAQLDTRPLKNKMSEFIERLSFILKERFNCNLQEKVKAKSGFEFKWTKSDTYLAISIFVIVGLIIIFSTIFNIPDYLIGSLILPIAYFVGRKLLRKK